MKRVLRVTSISRRHGIHISERTLFKSDEIVVISIVCGTIFATIDMYKEDLEVKLDYYQVLEILKNEYDTAVNQRDMYWRRRDFDSALECAAAVSTVGHIINEVHKLDKHQD